MTRPFQWVEAHGESGKWRHAIPSTAPTEQGTVVRSICAETIEVHSHHPQREAPYPECRSCDRTWRDVEGIPSVLDSQRSPS